MIHATDTSAVFSDRAASFPAFQAAMHELVEETDRLPFFFSSPGRRSSTGCRYDCDGLTIPVHWHEYLEFLYLKEGALTAIIQATTYKMSPGDLLIINSGELHMTRIGHISAHSPYVLLQFSARRMREFFPDLDLLHFKTHIPSSEIEKIPQLYHVLLEMQTLFDTQADGYQLLLTSRFYEFLHILYRHFSVWQIDKSKTSSGRDLRRITDIVDWTQANFRQPLTLDDAAGHLSISREYFCRIFKKYTGQTYLEFLCATRTMNLYEEMKTSDLSIPLLMERNGLTNYKTFLRTFRELYGTTPQKARQDLS